ncbi:MAG: 23S rRNA (adenine(2503)-C(2))-methyltransferase RlmN [Pseudomonadota bacterium]
MSAPAAKTNLLGLAPRELEAFFVGLGEKPFRARQMLPWLHRRRARDFAAMTDMSKVLRARLADCAVVTEPTVLSRQESADGTVKWLMAAGGGQAIETVFIPEPDRGTLCISSQVGCALDCAFCATAQQGFNRNLDTAEIVGQVRVANASLPPRANGEPAVTNVVFMGMGEPLANYRAVVPALRLLIADQAYGLSRRRVTLSTSGIVPQIDRLATDCNVSLAVSLHAANDELRNRLVPINRIHPIAELLDACWRYAAAHSNRHITFEYVMLDGINDAGADAQDLARLLGGRPAKVNLIPFNPFPGTRFRRSAATRIERFRDTLRRRGVVATVRRTRGDDIDAACGQLAGKVADRVRVRLSEKAVRA